MGFPCVLGTFLEVSDILKPFICFLDALLSKIRALFSLSFSLFLFLFFFLFSFSFFFLFLFSFSSFHIACPKELVLLIIPSACSALIVICPRLILIEHCCSALGKHVRRTGDLKSQRVIPKGGTHQSTSGWALFRGHRLSWPG